MSKEKLDREIKSNPGLGTYLAGVGVYPKSGQKKPSRKKPKGE